MFMPQILTVYADRLVLDAPEFGIRKPGTASILQSATEAAARCKSTGVSSDINAPLVHHGLKASYISVIQPRQDR